MDQPQVPPPQPPQTPPPQPLPQMPPPAASASEERTWAMAAHLAAFAGHFVPFGHIFGPLIVWVLKKDQFPLVNDQGKESMNAQISFTIYFLVSLCTCLLGIPLFLAVWVFDIVIVIIAAIKASEGQCYRYPMIIRFIT
jgi:uncharacterized protein